MENIGKLYIVATPIGNLGDITLRALETLKSVDFVLCEDTRVTQNLLNHFAIKTKSISYHQHSGVEKISEIIKLLETGKNLALVTDAGTPGISDPGNYLIAEIVKKCHAEFISASQGILKPVQDDSIVPIPGASAVITALSISGFSTDKFLFLGFPPHKKGRKTFFEELAKVEHTVCFYESNHRIKKCLGELADVLEEDRQMCVCRELTKKFETIYRGTIKEILTKNISEKGEFVIVISN
ncbi:MAG: Ribosomal RNA small subunit methyltransferase I [Candidatus Magasanikbacteria bacterium GW2011_GWC2_37_14]|uniref:Ribosomal RNA small subunit methyltransferase I n=1 Tax=Candidatus Magasanikbacteria bacterium GW2011_GWC2_37_14 TaxID=1619046 RepID=A0A0G0IV82_9BACT|nr:MAG: Ribosomal RNA small subunit methyltransferase I [Candidatus Magasanikbacteria bacterium GW2011_GWC2_37_14]